MAKYSVIRFSDLKRTIAKMRCDGLSECAVMQQVLHCLAELDVDGDE